MRKYINFLNIVFILLLLFSCTSNNNNQKDIFLSEFFNNESVYESLAKYYPNQSLIVFDKEKLLIQKSYGINNKNIKVQTIKPHDDNYFLVHNFILNKNLATIVLATSDMEKGIIYYLKRDKANEKWVMMNIIPKNSR